VNDERLQIAAVWAGVAGLLLTLVGVFLSGIFPPHRADISPSGMAAFYDGSTTRIQIGLLITFLGLAPFGPYLAAMCVQLLRIEGRHPVLAFTHLMSGTVVWLLFMLPMLILLAASFRPGRSPEVTQAIHDIGWIMIVLPISPFEILILAVGLAVLRDRSATPLYPRWIGYFSFWVAFLFLPAVLIPFFKSGPFSWHGLIGFWVPGAVTSQWLFMMAYTTVKAIKTPDSALVPAGAPLATPAPA
jgi:hypothetical protein